MLIALPVPDDTPRGRRAYRVPWRVDRIVDTHPLITNRGRRSADFVRVFTWTRGRAMTTDHRGRMLPGETVELCLCDADTDHVVVTIAWLRPEDGVEYVWRFVM